MSIKFYYDVYVESRRNQRLAKLGAEGGRVHAGLSFTPNVHFFKETPNKTKYGRDVRAAGFLDYRESYQNLDIFVRGGMSPRETVQTIFHEAEHLAQYANGNLLKLTREESERRAHRAELSAPVGRTYEEVFGELAYKLCKCSIRTAEFAKAEKYRQLLAEVDASAAEKLQWDCLSPEERDLRAERWNEKLLQQLESEKRVNEAVERFRQLRQKFQERCWWYR